MGRDSAIEWTDHTFNPWWGCCKVSPGCVNCYAEGVGARFGGGRSGGGPLTKLWGARARRRFFGDRHWAQPRRWNRAARRAARPARVFCGSMCDWLEELEAGHPDNAELRWSRLRIARTIDTTAHLRWLMLTKRPAALEWALGHAWPVGVPHNVWFGVTVEDNRRARERVPPLLSAPVRWRFLSCEPLLEAVDLSWALEDLDWVIAGCESGRARRSVSDDAFRRLRDQCVAAGVPFFLKQAERSQPGWGAAVVKLPELDGQQWAEVPDQLKGSSNAEESTM